MPSEPYGVVTFLLIVFTFVLVGLMALGVLPA